MTRWPAPTSTGCTICVRHPVRVGTAKYEASLAGVVVGGAARPVSPPVRVFFATPEPIAAAAIERRT